MGNQLDSGSRKLGDIVNSVTNELRISTKLISKNSNLSNFFTIFSLSEVTLKFSDSDAIYSDSSSFNSVGSSSSTKISNKEWDDTFLISDFPYSNQSYVAFLVSYKISINANDGMKFYENFFSKVQPNQNRKFSFEASVGVNKWKKIKHFQSL